MTDLHTHILPKMDDGAASVSQSIAMLRAEQEQGVDTVVLTPHFYRDRETAKEFLARRQSAFDTLQAALPEEHPGLLLGAEVAWYPSITGEKMLDSLCLDGTAQILLELPYAPWPGKMLDQLYQFVNATGLTPILAHVERYLSLQKRSQMEELLSMGFTMQMNAASLLQPLKRRKTMSLLQQGKWLLGSDCHNLDSRPPCMEQAVAYLEKNFSAEYLDTLLSWRP